MNRIKEINLRAIYEDNSPQRIAVCGHLPRLAATFRRADVPITESVIKRAISPFTKECGVSRPSFTRTLIAGLHRIGQTARADFLAASMVVARDRVRRLMRGTDFLSEMFNLAGEMAGECVGGNLGALRLRQFQMSELMLGAEVY